MTSEIMGVQCSARVEVTSSHRLPWRLVFCTNFLPPYRLPLLTLLTRAFREFTVLVSTDMEKNRPWKVNWTGVPVICQRCLSLKAHSRHPHGFNESGTVHIPYDTFVLLRRLQPDVVIAGEMGMRTILSALYCAAVPSCRLIIWATVSEVSEEGRGLVRRWLRRWLIRRASAILVNGASGRRYIEGLGGERERIFTVPYTTDLNPFLCQPVFRPPALRRRLLYVGQLIPRKNILAFLEACVRWCEQHRNRKLEILIVGDGELWGTLESFQGPANLRIELEHSAQYSEVPKLYQRAGIFVLPTLADEWGLVVNEAMAAGLPVLGSIYSQAMDEMVSDEVNGWKFSSDDPDDTYNAICRAMDCSDDQLLVMGERARAVSSAIRADRAADLIAEAIKTACLRAKTRSR